MSHMITDALGRRIDISGRVPFRAKETIGIPKEFFEERSDTVIIWLSNAGFLINSHGTIILIDPCLEMDRETMKSETGLKMLMEFPISTKELPKIDMVFYTHPDEDHVGPKTSSILAEKRVPRTASARTAEKLYESGALPEDVTKCRPGDKYQIGSCTVEVIIADHPWQLIDPRKFGEPLRNGDAVSFVIRTPDGGILCPGDTRLTEALYYHEGIDVVFLDVAKDPFHLGTDGAMLLANYYENAYLIPYHYGIFDAPESPALENGDPEDVFRYVKDAGDRKRILPPGGCFILKEHQDITGRK